MASAPDMPAGLRSSQLVALAAAVALIITGLVWELWWARTGSGTLALKVVPLCFALPGLFAMRLYTFRWVSLLVWLYFAEGIVRAASDLGAGRPLGALEASLAFLLFAACATHVRARQRVPVALP